MELIKNELYKIILNKGVCALIMLFIIFNGVYFAVQLDYKKIDKAVISSSIKEFEGPLTRDKVKKAEDRIDSINKISKATNRTIEISREETFKNNLYLDVRVMNSAYESNKYAMKNTNSSIKRTIGYDHRYFTLFHSMIRKSLNSKFFYIGGWDNIIEYVNSLGAIIMAAIILLGLSSMFSNEYSTKMDSIILSSKYGKTKLIKAKIGVSIIFIIMVDLFFVILNFAENIFIYGTHGWNAPIQALTNYMYSPFKFNILQYFFLQLLIHCLGCIAFVLFVLVISSISKTQIFTFFICSLVYVIPMLLDNAVALKTSLTELITRFSYSEFMQVEKMFKLFKAYNVLGFPVIYPIIAIITIGILIIISFFLIDRSFKNHVIDY